MRYIFLACFMVLLFPSMSDAGEKEPLTVLAAASLFDAMMDMQSAWFVKTGTEIRLSLAASSGLARQIEAGAPADLFISANVMWMDYLEKRGHVRPQTRCTLLSNRLVLIAPADGVQGAFTGDDLPDIVARLGAKGRLALGDPQHVPAGLYAREALLTAGQWHSLKNRLAPADNVRAALALVMRKEAALGIVYETDVQDMAGVHIVGRIPARLHRLIRYDMAVITNSRHRQTDDFMAFMLSDEGRAIFRRFGFQIFSQPGVSC